MLEICMKKKVKSVFKEQNHKFGMAVSLCVINLDGILHQ